MKKLIALMCVLTVLCGASALGDTRSVRTMTDQELKAMYRDILAEAGRRGLALAEAVTLPEGRYIVGVDIQPGTYAITCVSTDAEDMSSGFGALGSALDRLDGGGTSYSDIYSSFGSALAAMDSGVTVEIVGDYGTILKTLRLKKGETAAIRLEGKVALKVSDGTCTLEAK